MLSYGIKFVNFLKLAPISQKNPRNSSDPFATVFPSQLTKINLNRYFMLFPQEVWSADVHGNVQLHFSIHQLQSTKESKFPFLLFSGCTHCNREGKQEALSLFSSHGQWKLRDFFLSSFSTLFYRAVQSIKQHVCKSRKRDWSENVQLHIETTWFLLSFSALEPHFFPIQVCQVIVLHALLDLSMSFSLLKLKSSNSEFPSTFWSILHHFLFA